MESATAAKITTHDFAKGDVIGVARIAAIQAAKRTPELVPSVFGAMLGAIEIDFVVGEESVSIEVRVASRDGRSVEMEALTACAVAALTIYDMCKAIDRSMMIGQLMLCESASTTAVSE